VYLKKIKITRRYIYFPADQTLGYSNLQSIKFTFE
jgi:hypothetical protein